VSNRFQRCQCAFREQYEITVRDFLVITEQNLMAD
jgi:hypothetical protein